MWGVGVGWQLVYSQGLINKHKAKGSAPLLLGLGGSELAGRAPLLSLCETHPPGLGGLAEALAPGSGDSTSWIIAL